MQLHGSILSENPPDLIVMNNLDGKGYKCFNYIDKNNCILIRANLNRADKYLNKQH